MKLLVFIVVSALCACAKIPQKVLICGVCRDVESRLEKTIEIMESIGALFVDYRLLVYENNSKDRTPQILQEWQKRNHKLWLRSERVPKEVLEKEIVNREANGSFFAPEMIARARNIVLEKALSSEYANFPFVIWMDMDFVLKPDLRGFIDTFKSRRKWDGVFALGIDPDRQYWDWYALRNQHHPFGPEIIGPTWWQTKKQWQVTQKNTWQPVYSAFGGCGIYRKEAIKNCRYSALVTCDLERLMLKLLNKSTLDWKMDSVYYSPSVCEHVPFHASMILQGYDKLYINPRLIFRYGG